MNKAGRWVMTVDIKQFLDPSKPHQEIGRLIEAEFRKQIMRDEYQELDDILECLQTQDSVEEFDCELNALYDWADAHKVWLGLRP